MKVIEFGNKNNEIIMLLHGGGLSWWHYKEVAYYLEKDYYVILPILDGHSNSDHSFTSIEDNALEIIEYIDKNFNGSILFMGGCSLGAQILVEILSQRKNICKFAFIESALVFPMRITHLLTKSMLDMSYGLINKKWFSKLQFKELKIKDEYFNDYYKDSCNITKNDMISFLEANTDYKIKDSIKDIESKVFIFVGNKEQKIMIKSAIHLNKLIPNSVLEILNMYHGEFSMNHAEEYVHKMLDIIKNHL